MEKRMGAAILLALSLVATTTAAGVAEEVDSTIRLPSDGKDENFINFWSTSASYRAIMEKVITYVGSGLAKQVRPWTCCDLISSLPQIPPLFFCDDEVEQCAAACKNCQEVEDSPSLKVCTDMYSGYDEGPRCTEEGNANHDVYSGVVADHKRATPMAEETRVVAEEEEQEGPPWECCERIFCKRIFSKTTFPVITCQCKDTVKHCASACKSCEKVNGGSVCNDWYQGDPDPACY